MAQFLDMSEESAREALSHVGVQIISEGDRQREHILTDALGSVSVVDRVTVDIAPPSPGDEFLDMGAWHVRPQAEAHSVLLVRVLWSL